MALGEGQINGMPPGLQLPGTAAGDIANQAVKARDVHLISKDMIQRTDEMLQEKVDQILVTAADQLQKGFQRQQEQMNASLEMELKTCQDKVTTLEADKKEMQQSVQMLQEQLNALTSQIFAGQQGWPMQMQGQMQLGGSLVNAGMRGPFSTLPSGLRLFQNPSPESDEQASEPSTMAPPSPLMMPSAPPTPSHLPMSMPPMGLSSPPPPPGLPGLPGLMTSSMPFGTPSRQPVASPFGTPCSFPPPPGLEESLLDECRFSLSGLEGPQAVPARKMSTISLSDAIDTPLQTTPQMKPKADSFAEMMSNKKSAEKARQNLEESERQALKMMFSGSSEDNAADEFAQMSEKFLSPKVTTNPAQFQDSSNAKFLSPKMTAERMMQFHSPQSFCSPRTRTPTVGPLGTTPNRLTLTPKGQRTPTNKRFGTPGMRSPAITASPFVICEGGGTVFGFTIRKADDCELGVEFVNSDCGSCLQVTAIRPGGAMQAWNKLCAGGPSAGKAMLPGDKVVKVNELTTTNEMLRECSQQKLLKFTVQRGEVEDDVDAQPLQPWCLKPKGLTT